MQNGRKVVDKMVTLELENMIVDKCLALAQLVKRLTFSYIRGCAVDDDEAYVIKDAVNELQKALDAAG